MSVVCFFRWGRTIFIFLLCLVSFTAYANTGELSKCISAGQYTGAGTSLGAPVLSQNPAFWVNWNRACPNDAEVKEGMGYSSSVEKGLMVSLGAFHAGSNPVMSLIYSHNTSGGGNRAHTSRCAPSSGRALLNPPPFWGFK